MPAGDRGSVWIVNPGMAAKVRPCVILSVPTDSQDRVLITVVPHTTSVQGTRLEVDIQASFPKAGVFDAQQVVTVAQARLIRHIGDMTSAGMAQIEDAVRRWLGM